MEIQQQIKQIDKDPSFSTNTEQKYQMKTESKQQYKEPTKDSDYDITKQIYKIINHSLDQEVEKKIVNLKHPSFNKGESFIQTYQNQSFKSKIKNSYITAYKQQFSKDGTNELQGNPQVVQQILYNGLCASGMAAYRWKSVNTKRRMAKETPLCPDLAPYPLDSKQQHRSLPCKDSPIKRKLIENRCKSLDKYIDTIIYTDKKKTKIYGEERDNYDQIMHYAIESDTTDIIQAQKDVSYIMSLKNKINSTRRPIQTKIKARSFHRGKYQDQDDVYQVRPNRIPKQRLKMVV